MSLVLYVLSEMAALLLFVAAPFVEPDLVDEDEFVVVEEEEFAENEEPLTGIRLSAFVLALVNTNFFRIFFLLLSLVMYLYVFMSSS
jgi:hypothetical protein